MELSLGAALIAGVVAFFSPCCLPLYPSYLAYLSGVQTIAVRHAPTARERWIVCVHAGCFMLGFSVIYFVLGASIGWFSSWFYDYQETIAKVSGILLIVMGCVVVGLLRLPNWMRTVQWSWATGWGRTSYIGSFLFGLGFAAGWTPCIGPSLATIIALAASEPQQWWRLTMAYTLGFGVPFLLLAIGMSQLSRWSRWIPLVSRIGGGMLILFGALLLTGHMTSITLWMNRLFSSTLP